MLQGTGNLPPWQADKALSPQGVLVILRAD